MKRAFNTATFQLKYTNVQKLGHVALMAIAACAASLQAISAIRVV